MEDRCLKCPVEPSDDGFLKEAPMRGLRSEAAGVSRSEGPFARPAPETGLLDLRGILADPGELPDHPRPGMVFFAGSAGYYGGVYLAKGDAVVCVGTNPSVWAPLAGAALESIDASRLTGTAHVDTTGNAATADRVNHGLAFTGSGASMAYDGSAARGVAMGSGLSMSVAGGVATLSTAASGVAPGSYNAVVVGADGRVTQGSNPSTLAGHGITDAYTKQEIDSRLTSGMHYKGNVATYSDLPSSGQLPGDFWNVLDTGRNYAWDGTEWDYVGDLVDYAPITDAAIDDITEH